MDESKLELIASYLDGTMTPEERLSFEILVNEDPVLEKELLLSKKIHHHFENPYQEEAIPDNAYTQQLKETLASDEAKKIKETIKEIGSKYQEEHSNVALVRPWMYAAAAVLILFFAVNFFLNTSTADMYATYYNDKDVPSIIQRDGEKTLLSQGVNAFHANNFEEAVRLFEDYETENAISNTGFYILKGIAYSHIGDLESATKSFDKCIASKSLDSSKGLWFKALAFVKADEVEKAKNTLLQIGDNDFNYKKAQELLANL